MATLLFLTWDYVEMHIRMEDAEYEVRHIYATNLELEGMASQLKKEVSGLTDHVRELEIKLLYR